MNAKRVNLIVKFLERVFQSSHAIRSVEMISKQAVKVNWSQNNVRENTASNHSNVYLFNEEQREIGQKLNDFPLSVASNISVNSPEGTYRAIVQKVQDKTNKTKSNQVIEVYRGEDIVSQISLSEHHEQILDDDLVGSAIIWNKEESKFLYIAQVKQKPTKTYFEIEEEKDLDDVKRKYLFEQDYGEKMNEITKTQLFEFDIQKNILSKIEIPENIFPCYPTYLDTQGEEIILQGYQIHPEFKYGILHCFNREIDIFHMKNLQRTQLFPKPPKVEGKEQEATTEKKVVDFKIISKDEVSFMPILSDDGKKISYFGAPLSPPHINYFAMKIINTSDWSVEEIIPIQYENLVEEGKCMGIVGFYCDLRHNFWLNDNKHFVFSSAYGTSLGSFIVNTETKQVARFNQNKLLSDEFQIIYYNSKMNTLFASHNNLYGPCSLAFLKNLDLSKDTVEIAKNAEWQYINLSQSSSSIFPSLRNCGLDFLEEQTIRSGEATGNLWRIKQFNKDAIPKELQDLYDDNEKLNPLNQKDDERPLLVDVHGGPHGVYSGIYITANLYSLLQGYNILAPNFTGSIGFGQDYINKLLTNIGDIDAKEIINMIDQVIEKKLCNPQKVIIMGCSYGGYMTAIMASRYSDRFLCSFLMNPVVNLPFTFNISDIPDWTVAESLGKKMTWNLTGDDYKKMFELSPMSQPNKVPTLNLLGAKDRRVPYQQSLAYHAQSVQNGTEIETYIYPESDHSINESLHTFFDTIMKQIIFIEKNLLK